MKKRRQSNTQAEYERLGVQRMTSQKVSREIYGILYDRRNYISQCNQVKMLESMRIHLVVNVKRTIRHRELVEGQKVEKVNQNFKQKKNKRSSKISGIIEEVYSEGQYMGEEGKLEKYERSNNRV